MRFEFTGRHIEVTPALRSHVENHFGKLKHLFEGNSATAHIVIEVEKGRHRAEVLVKWRDHVLTADSTVADMYQALTKSIDKIEKQALKIKTKVTDKHQKATKASKLDNAKDEVAPAPDEPKLIPTERYAIKPMTPEEAVLMLKTEENRFLVYRDSVTERVSVVYNRKDGNYGLIQP